MAIAILGYNTVNTYIKLRNKVGSFWALYFIGIENIYSLKFSILTLLQSIILSIIFSYSMNKIIIMNRGSNSENTSELNYFHLYWLCVCTFIQIVESITTILLEKPTTHEKNMIARRVFNFANILYLESSNEWKIENPNMAQKESLNGIFNAYNNLSSVLEHLFLEIINTIVIIIVAFMEEPILCIIIISSTIFLITCNHFLSKEKSSLNKSITSIISNISIEISNQYTNRVDYTYNNMFPMLYDNIDPVVGIVKQYNVWDDRAYITKKTRNIIAMIKNCLILLICLYLYYADRSKLIFFILINREKLFGMMNCIRIFTEVRDLTGGRLTSSFNMVDSLVDCHISPKMNKMRQASPNLNSNSNLNKFTVRIVNIHRKVSPTITLKYNGIINIDLMKKGIILLDGVKGCGKSITMDIIAGMYDGKVTKGVYINGKRLQDEFRDFMSDRIYIRQCIGDDYRMNKKNTITMTLAELFPNGSYDDIIDFLVTFDINQKMPKDLITVISMNEKELSPGQIQSIILASQLWKTILLKKPLLLLDEPERNIDFDSVKKIFDMLIQKYPGTIILITHSGELKKYLDDINSIKQKWIYKSPTHNSLSFEVKTI